MKKDATLFRMGVILEKGPHCPRRVAFAGPFHFDNISPVVCKKLGAIGAGDVPGQIYYLDT